MQGVITPIFLVLAAIIGLLIGLLVSNLTSAREKKTSPDDDAKLALQKEGIAEA
jgi:Ni/Fe-hydrogenase subunit HybB-like protein